MAYAIYTKEKMVSREEKDSLITCIKVVFLYGMILIMLPFFFLAMYERDGMPLEVLMQHFIEAKFIRPKERPYKTNNYYAALMRMAQADKEVREIGLEAEKRQGGRKSEAAGKPDRPRKAENRKDH